MEQSDNSAQYDPMKWKNMRRMAYIGILACLIWPIAVHFDSKLIEITVIWLGFWGTVIGGYMGFSTWRDGWGNK